MTLPYLAVALLFVVVFSSDTGTLQIKRPDVVAIVNGEVIPTLSARVIALAENKDKGEGDHRVSSLRQVAESLVEEALWADYIHRNIGMRQILAENRTGLPIWAHVENQYFDMIHRAYSAEISTYIRDRLKGEFKTVVTARFDVDDDVLKAWIGLQSPHRIELLPEQRQRARRTVLLRYQFPWGQTGGITLWDIYCRQNIQGKNRIHNANMNFLRQQVDHRLSHLFLDAWLRDQIGLNASEIRTLRRAVFNRQLVADLLVYQGVYSVLHRGNLRLQQVAKTISTADIARYYEHHREAFKRVVRARGRRLIVADKASAERAYNVLSEGQSWQSVLARFAVENTVTDYQGEDTSGDTGWLQRGEGNLWLQTLLFSQPLKEYGRPVRRPQWPDQNNYWEIVIVDHRETVYPDVTDPGIRYEISRRLAKQQLVEEFHQLRRSLHETAYIRYNRNVLEALR